MAEIHPTEVLRNEHRAVERVLKAMDRAAGSLEAGEPVSLEVFDNSLDFLRTFADKCHHGKEERLLFPAMERAGVAHEGGPIGVMLLEHNHGREYIRAMADALVAYRSGDEKAKQSLIQNTRAYTALLSQHIRKEDEVLFPMAERLLSEDEQKELLEEFDRVEAEHIGPGVHERYHQMIDELEEQTANGS